MVCCGCCWLVLVDKSFRMSLRGLLWNIEALVAGTEDESMSLVPKVAPPE